MKQRCWMRICSAVISLACVVPMTSAHHSSSDYDTRQVVTVTGAVSKIDWFNPHVYIYIDEPTSDDKKVEWEIEGFPPALFRRIGWQRDTVRIGDVITVAGSPKKNPNDKGIFPSRIARGDKVLFVLKDALTPVPRSTTVKANGLSGVWSTALTYDVVTRAAGPADAQLTKAGADARKRFDEKSSPTTHCIPVPAPWWMITPELKRLTVAGNTVYIEGELGVRRTVHMNLETHEGATASIQGHSIGRWDDTTLVIDTTAFAYHGTGNGGGNGIGPGVPSSTEKHLVERLTPKADGTVTYSYQLTDPQYLASPRKGEVEWTFSPNEKFEVESCDMGNAHRFMKN